jgi:hypothetical protein
MRLFAADALCQSHLKCGTRNLTPLSEVSDRTGRWPFCEQLLRKAEGSTHLAVTLCADAATVSAMMAAAIEAAAVTSLPTAMIVHSADTLPPTLIDGVPECLRSLLRRIDPMDLLVIPAQSCTNSAVETRLPDQILSDDFCTVTLPSAPDSERFPAVGPGRANVDIVSVRAAVQRIADTLRLTGHHRKCLESGILLLWDHLDESHQISQTMEGQGTPRTADYWHGIMHRREPDAGNAAWWFRKVGSHPALKVLGAGLISWMQQLGAAPNMLTQAKRLLRADRSLDPFSMIEMSTRALSRPGQDEEQTVRMVQYLEMITLLQFSLPAVGHS